LRDPPDLPLGPLGLVSDDRNPDRDAGGLLDSFLRKTPALEVYEEKDDIVVKAELPGLAKPDLDIHLTGSTLSIRGEKKKEEEVKHEDYYRSERSRTAELSSEGKADQIKASFKEGVLEVRLPKTEEARKPVQVKIT